MFGRNEEQTRSASTGIFLAYYNYLNPRSFKDSSARKFENTSKPSASQVYSRPASCRQRVPYRAAAVLKSLET